MRQIKKVEKRKDGFVEILLTTETESILWDGSYHTISDESGRKSMALLAHRCLAMDMIIKFAFNTTLNICSNIF
jgi:hypothetical protein